MLKYECLVVGVVGMALMVAESASEERVRLDGVELGVASEGRPRFAPEALTAGDDFAAAARFAAAASALARLCLSLPAYEA